ncbi:uncharacterized protein [Triticum aestivum]|uniref:uncharacterized protein n=1 Tax=Triticum aestivum TaxID=4565 RepID=UPI001D018094|nr:uncharacterized protein LOC123101346 [Triticum aestivum]
MAREGDVPDNETEGYANPISRRNSKRAAKRQPHGDDKDGDEEGDDGVERFLLVKLQRRKVRTEAVSKGIDATSSAAVAELLLQGEIWLGGKGEVKEEGSEQEEKGSPPFHPCWCCLVFSDISGDGDPDLGTPCSSGKKVGAWGKEVGGQEGVRASEGDGRACDGSRTASNAWFVELMVNSHHEKSDHEEDNELSVDLEISDDLRIHLMSIKGANRKLGTRVEELSANIVGVENRLNERLTVSDRQRTDSL